MEPAMNRVRIGYHRLFALPLLLVAGNAAGDNGVKLSVTNDGIVDIFVTVYDMSAKPYVIVVNHQRMNGFTTIPISVNPDATGKASVSWTAISVDDRDRQCGRAAKTGLDDGATVNVHVDSGCAGQ
jgi:hypothetical protein